MVGITERRAHDEMPIAVPMLAEGRHRLRAAITETKAPESSPSPRAEDGGLPLVSSTSRNESVNRAYNGQTARWKITGGK